MSSETKNCPFCQETIDLNESVCPYCGEKLDVKEKIENKKNTNKTVIVAIISSVVLITTVIILACVAIFIIKPHFENKAVIEAFKNSFQKTYPNLTHDLNDLNFNKLNILSKHNDEAVYSITV